MALLYNKDFDTGNLSQWRNIGQMVSPDRIRTVTSPVRQGTHAARIEVRSGDNPTQTAGRERAEIWDNFPPIVQGTNQFWTASWRLPASWQAIPAPIIMQSHGEGGGQASGQPPIQIRISGTNDFEMVCIGGVAGANTVQFRGIINGVFAEKDVWHDFIFDHLYSWSGNGHEVVYHKLQSESSWERLFNEHNLSNLYTNQAVYWKTGLYRPESSITSIFYLDAVRVYSTLSEAQAFMGGGSVPPVALSITTTSLVGGTVGQLYSQTVQATGGTPPRTWSIVSGSLPQGLSLSTSGIISGTPGGPAGTSTFTIRVTDSAATQVQRELSIVISSAPPSNVLDITTTELPDAEKDAAYSQLLQATGGITPYTWALQSFGTQSGEYYFSDIEISEIIASISNTATPWATAAWNAIKTAADSALTANPNPADGSPTAYNTDSTATCTGTTQGWRTCLYSPGLTDGHRARNLALAYRITGTASYGDRARDFCMAWANTYTPLPTRSSIGHYVAEPVGAVIKLCLAYMLAKDRFTTAQQTTFRNWAGLFIERFRLNVYHAYDDPWDPASLTFNGQTINYPANGNGTMWQRVGLVVCAAVVGGQTLTDALNWNWQNTSPGGSATGWDAMLHGHIINGSGTAAPTGETFEGRQRTSLGYGMWSVAAGLIIADIAKHAGFHTDLFNYATSRGKSLLLPWRFYGPAIEGGTWPYTQAETFMSGSPQDTIRRQYRSIAETAYKNASSGANKTQLGEILAVGTSTARGQNTDTHIFGNNTITSQAFGLDTGGSGSLPPGLSFSSSGIISGTPTTLGSYPFGVQVTDNVGALDSQGLAIGVVDNPDPPPPPPPITPTDPDDFGRDAVSTSTLLTILQPNVIIGTKYNLTRRRAIPRLWVYLTGISTTTGTALFIPGIYANDAGGLVPGTLLYQYEVISIVPGYGLAFYSSPRGAIPEIDSGIYWLAGHAGGDEVAQYGYEPVDNALQRATLTYTGTLPSPYPASSSAVGELVIYAEQVAPTVTHPKSSSFTDPFDSLDLSKWVVVE